jgi:hypothetical protein
MKQHYISLQRVWLAIFEYLPLSTALLFVYTKTKNTTTKKHILSGTLVLWIKSAGAYLTPI